MEYEYEEDPDDSDIEEELVDEMDMDELLEYREHRDRHIDRCKMCNYKSSYNWKKGNCLVCGFEMADDWHDYEDHL